MGIVRWEERETVYSNHWWRKRNSGGRGWGGKMGGRNKGGRILGKLLVRVPSVFIQLRSQPVSTFTTKHSSDYKVP